MVRPNTYPKPKGNNDKKIRDLITTSWQLKFLTSHIAIANLRYTSVQQAQSTNYLYVVCT